MPHSSRYLFLSLISACAALTPACAHRTPDPLTGPPERRLAHVPSSREVPAVTTPVVHPYAAARDRSAILLAELDGRVVAYVADEDDSLVRVIDVDDARELSSVRLGGVPGQLVMRKDGRLLVTLRDTAQLVVLGGGGSESSKLTIEKQIDVPTDPVGLALSPDERTLVVTSAWGKAVTVLDAVSFELRAEHAVAREPRGVVVSSDGNRAFVAHMVGGTLDVIALDGTTPFDKVEAYLESL